jgi:hypothetical protein
VQGTGGSPGRAMPVVLWAVSTSGPTEAFILGVPIGTGVPSGQTG